MKREDYKLYLTDLKETFKDIKGDQRKGGAVLARLLSHDRGRGNWFLETVFLWRFYLENLTLYSGISVDTASFLLEPSS